MLVEGANKVATRKVKATTGVWVYHVSFFALLGAEGAIVAGIVAVARWIGVPWLVICRSDPLVVKGEWGDRLYVVMAMERANEREAQAWAGLGWVQQAATGKGLFVEHHGRSEAAVRVDISASLDSLVAGRHEMFGPSHTKLARITCKDQTVCALVVAVFQAEPWWQMTDPMVERKVAGRQFQMATR